MKRGLGLFLCIAPQVLVVAGVVVREELVRQAGVVVRLEVRAVDPMSLFSGRYVSTPLAITRVDERETRIAEGLARGSEVFVALEERGSAWIASAVTRERPRESGIVYLRGTWMQDGTIDYGLDRFYIPEDGADPSALARRFPGGDAPLLVEVRIDANGRGSICDLIVLGHPYAEWNASEKGRAR